MSANSPLAQKAERMLHQLTAVSNCVVTCLGDIPTAATTVAGIGQCVYGKSTLMTRRDEHEMIGRPAGDWSCLQVLNSIGLLLCY